MKKTRRKFTPEEKLSILQEVEREGTIETCRKYHLSSSMISSWKRKYLSQGLTGLKGSYRRIDPAVRALEQENERLKRLIAKQAIEIDFKTELLKHAEVSPLKKKR